MSLCTIGLWCSTLESRWNYKQPPDAAFQAWLGGYDVVMSPGKMLKCTTKARNRRAMKLHEFVTRAVSIARKTWQLHVASHSATRLSKIITQQWLSRTVKDAKPQWPAVWRFQRQFSWTSSNLLHFRPVYLHLNILRTPFSVCQFNSFLRQWGCVSVSRIAQRITQQEIRAVARKPRDAAAVLFGLKFADNIHYKLKSSGASKARLHNSKLEIFCSQNVITHTHTDKHTNTYGL